MNVELIVSGMTCNSCVNRVDAGLTALNEVDSTTIDLESGLVKINLVGEIETIKLENIVKELGYSLNGELPTSDYNWVDVEIWKKSAHNTKWCLIGCSIGDFGTIAAFQFLWPNSGWSTMSIMILAIINGLLTSIALETIILAKQLGIYEGFKVAIGMSFISMVAMESSMNITDYLMTGGAMLTLSAVPIMLLVGFLTPWPYNYWRLKKYGKSCH